MHYAQETKFSWHKSLTCPEGLQLTLVYCSLHETCEGWFLLHYSVGFGSEYIPGRKKTKNTLNTEAVLFSVCFAFLMSIHTEVEYCMTCVQNSPNKDSHLRMATVPEVTQYPQERTLPWQTSATYPECAPIRLMRHRASHVALLGVIPI